MRRLFPAVFVMLLAVTPAANGKTFVRHFSSVLFGHIRVGSAASRYETTFVVNASQPGRIRVLLFNDRGEPMPARFVDLRGETAETGSATFEFSAGRDEIRLGLKLEPADDAEEIAVKSGWATFESDVEFEVSAHVRIASRDGRSVQKHTLLSEKPNQS